MIPRLAVGVALGVLANPVGAQVTERVSLGVGGVQGNADAVLPPPGRVISADGRFVAWASFANNLVAGDTNVAWDIFVRDRLMQTTERVSVDSQGNQSDGISGLYGISMSADGRFIAFESAANNLVPGDTNGTREVFVRDRQAGTTERVALDSSGAQANGPSFYPSLSADGRYVAFTSPASNLVVGDTNGKWDIFVRDRQSGTTERISLGPGGVQGNGDSYEPEISADGNWVVFQAAASNLVGSDTNAVQDVFLRDRVAGTTQRVSIGSNGTEANAASAFGQVSSTGQFISFLSTATNLVPGDTNAQWDTFVRDCQTGVTELVSVATNGTQSNGMAGYSAISGDGRFVLFGSNGSNLAPNDANGFGDVFLRDRVRGTTSLVSVATNGWAGTGGTGAGVGSISSDGRYAVLKSDSTNLIAGDSNALADIFIRDLRAAGFTSTCDAGNGGVISCPCGNPPAGTGRGCDNSSATGGAVISASGAAYVSRDSLVFTTSGERPTSTSILIQGDAEISSGIVFGQGVRCVGGSIKRLYLKAAVAGCITAPDFNAGDPSISARSSALGAPIQPGQPYYYLVYYRDPFVLGGCPATSGFNATQTGAITWWP